MNHKDAIACPNSHAEIKNDRDEYPQPILDRARDELMDKALDGLTLTQILDALTSSVESSSSVLIAYIQESRFDMAGCRVHTEVSRYLEPSETEIQQRADKILAELGEQG